MRADARNREVLLPFFIGDLVEATYGATQAGLSTSQKRDQFAAQQLRASVRALADRRVMPVVLAKLAEAEEGEVR